MQDGKSGEWVKTKPKNGSIADYAQSWSGRETKQSNKSDCSRSFQEGLPGSVDGGPSVMKIATARVEMITAMGQ